VKTNHLQLIPSTQVPPLKHAPVTQSLILFSHVLPSKPVPVQLHEKSLTKSVQVPPFLHGPDAQSSILLLHVGPSYPEAQLHENAII